MERQNSTVRKFLKRPAYTSIKISRKKNPKIKIKNYNLIAGSIANQTRQPVSNYKLLVNSTTYDFPRIQVSAYIFDFKIFKLRSILSFYFLVSSEKIAFTRIMIIMNKMIKFHIVEKVFNYEISFFFTLRIKSHVKLITR